MANFQKLRIFNSAAIVTPTIFNNLLDMLSIGKTNTIGIYARGATVSSFGVTQSAQQAAVRLFSDLNTIGTVNVAGDGVKLPDAIQGISVTVKNDGDKNLSVFPYETDSIDGYGANVAILLSPGDLYTFNSINSTQWISTNMRGTSGSVGATGSPGAPGATGSSSGSGSTSAYSLGLALPFAALAGGTITVGNAQLIIPSGDIGETTLVNPTNITLLGGVDRGATASPVTVANDMYNTLSVLTAVFTFGATNFEAVNAGYGTGRFVPGVYRGTSYITTSATQTITLVGDGDYVFISDATIDFGADTTFVLKNGAKSSRIFFVAAGAITTGANNILKGNFITPAAINVGATNDIEGRLLSTISAAITIDGTATTLYLPS